MKTTDHPAAALANAEHTERIVGPGRANRRRGRELETTSPSEAADESISMTWTKARLALIVATWQNDLRADLTRMIGQIERVSATEGDWAILQHHLAAVEPDFAEHIEQGYPALTLLEKKISLLMGLGLPVAEIARTLRQKETAVARCTRQIQGRLAASQPTGGTPPIIDNNATEHDRAAHSINLIKDIRHAEDINRRVVILRSGECDAMN